MSSGSYGLVGAMELERLEEEQRWGLTDGGAKMGAGSRRRSDGASSQRRCGRAVGMVLVMGGASMGLGALEKMGQLQFECIYIQTRIWYWPPC